MQLPVQLQEALQRELERMSRSNRKFFIRRRATPNGAMHGNSFEPHAAPSINLIQLNSDDDHGLPRPHPADRDVQTGCAADNEEEARKLGADHRVLALAESLPQASGPNWHRACRADQLRCA